MKLFSISLLVLILCSCNSTTIYMVRHAEKADENNPDPGLTTAGFARAEALKDTLQYASIDAIVVSDFQRTQLTAQPLADHLNLQLIVIPLKEAGVEQYIEGVVDEINTKWSGKNVLVVTHNPLYQLIGQRLNAPDLPAINDETGYDHFFVITRSTDASAIASLSHSRYGAKP
jgi:broad specificity phosphatase PhoE